MPNLTRRSDMIKIRRKGEYIHRDKEYLNEDNYPQWYNKHFKELVRVMKENKKAYVD